MTLTLAKTPVINVTIMCPHCKTSTGKTPFEVSCGELTEDFLCPICEQVVFSIKPEKKPKWGATVYTGCSNSTSCNPTYDEDYWRNRYDD